MSEVDSTAGSAEKIVPATTRARDVPVPVSVIVKHAVSKCNRCFGRGLIKFIPNGSEKAKDMVCRCALKRFVAANRGRIVSGTDRNLYYRDPLLDDVKTAGEATPRTAVVTGNEDAVRDRFRTGLDRIAELDAELKEIDADYDEGLVPLVRDLQEQRTTLDKEKAIKNVLQKDLDWAKHQFDETTATIKDLEEKLRLAYKKKDSYAFDIECIAQQILGEGTRLLPYELAVAKADAAFESHEKHRFQAKKPAAQRKASLEKRLAHRAASLGMSLDEARASVVQVKDQEGADRSHVA